MFKPICVQNGSDQIIPRVPTVWKQDVESLLYNIDNGL